MPAAQVPYKERNAGADHTPLPLPAHCPGITLANSWPLLPLPWHPLALGNGRGSAFAWGWLPAWWATLRRSWSMTPVLFGDQEEMAKAPINPGSQAADHPL